VIENPALKELHTQLTRYALRELRLFNEAEDERGFHPHITVAFRDLKKPKFYALKETFETEKIDGQFAYSGFSLLKLDKKWEAYKQFTHKKSL
jgi:2'-5' RNA ligase